MPVPLVLKGRAPPILTLPGKGISTQDDGVEQLSPPQETHILLFTAAFWDSPLRLLNSFSEL